MAVSFKAIRYVNAPILASDVSTAVKRMPAGLAEARAGTMDRHLTGLQSFRSMLRSLRTPDITNGVIRRDRAVVDGLGSITLGQTFSHPDVGEVTGQQIDYWALGFTRAEHADVTGQLIERARARGEWVLGALLEDEIPFAEGIPDLLQPIGKPGDFTMPNGDPHNVLASGKPVQLYAQHWIDGSPQLT